MKTLHDNMGNTYEINSIYEFSDDIRFSWCHIGKLAEYDCLDGTFLTDAEQEYKFCREVAGKFVKIGSIDNTRTIPSVGCKYMFLHAGKLKVGTAFSDDCDLLISVTNDDGSVYEIDFIDCELFTLIENKDNK